MTANSAEEVTLAGKAESLDLTVPAEGGATDDDELSGDELARAALEDVAALVASDRDTHGDAVENQSHIARGWTWYLRGQGILDEDEAVTGTDVAAMMSIVKFSRQAVGDEDVDHLRDVAGYAGIGAACMVADGRIDLDELTVEDYSTHE